MLSSSNQNQSSRFRYYKRSCRATWHCLYFCLLRIKETIIVPFPQDSSVLTSDPLAMRHSYRVQGVEPGRAHDISSRAKPFFSALSLRRVRLSYWTCHLLNMCAVCGTQEKYGRSSQKIIANWLAIKYSPVPVICSLGSWFLCSRISLVLCS